MKRIHNMTGTNDVLAFAMSDKTFCEIKASPSPVLLVTNERTKEVLEFRPNFAPAGPEKRFNQYGWPQTVWRGRVM